MKRITAKTGSSDRFLVQAKPARRSSLRRSLLSVAAFALLALFLAPTQTVARDWEGSFTVSIAYRELTGSDTGSADVSLIMILPAGTPLLSREAAVGSALAALKDIWNIESVHEDVLGFLGPQIPMDVQRLVSQVEGSEFVMAVVEAFDTVENAGFSRIQSDTSVTATERLPLGMRLAPRGDYPDAPRTFEWVIGGGLVDQNRNHENWVLASMINYSAALLSFRSEFLRFPGSLAELRESGHLFIEPLNPYTGEQIREVDRPSPGDITFGYVNPNRVVLYGYLALNGILNVVTRDIGIDTSSGAFDLLYRQTAGLSENDKQVARYMFQISQILSEYYSEHGDLPYSVPQCETEGFAYVSFPNPYTGRDAQQADSLANIRPGDYTYHRVSASSYFLVGYGEDGNAILSISKDLPPK